MPIGDGPLIVQSDKTVLLEIDHPKAQEARNALAPFAELERAPEHVHTYRITPLALWNARPCPRIPPRTSPATGRDPLGPGREKPVHSGGRPRLHPRG